MAEQTKDVDAVLKEFRRVKGIIMWELWGAMELKENVHFPSKKLYLNISYMGEGIADPGFWVEWEGMRGMW